MQERSFEKIPDGFIKKWQEIADLIATIVNVPAALIMKTENEFMEVFTSSKTENNLYKVGDTEHWHGLYCETVIKTQKKLRIPNALKDKNWDKNPDIKLGMIAYLGYPINFPDQKPFGTLCVLDNKERQFSAENEKLLLQFKKVIELDLALIFSLGLTEKYSHADIIQKLSQDNKEYQATNEELEQTNAELLKAQQKAKESKETYRNLFQNAQVGLFRTRISDGKILESNKQLAVMFGYDDLDNFIAEYKTSDNYVDKGAREKMIEMIKENGFIQNFEARFYRKDKSIFWANYSARIFPDKGWIEGVAEDITEKKLAEEALRESEDRLSKIMIAANDGMWDWDLKTNQAYFDPRYYKLSGYDVDEFPHKLAEFQKRVHPDDVDYVMNETEKHLKGEIDRFEVKFRFLKKSGDWQWIQGKGIIVERDEKGIPQRFVGTHRDISELKRVEEALRSNYELLRIAGETARFGGWNVDLEKNISNWSDAVADIHEVPHGYSTPVEEGINFYAPEWRDKITQVFTDCAQKGIPYDEEMEIITLKEKRLWVRTIGRAVKDETGKISKVQGSFQDITARKQVEEDLRQSEKRYRLLAKNTLDIIWVMTMDARFTYVNPAIQTVFGFSPDEWIGSGLWEHCDKHHFARMKTLIEKEAAKGLEHQGVIFEAQMLRRDGSAIDVEIHGQVIFNDQNEPVSLQGVTRDITDRKKAEQLLKESEERFKALHNASFGGIAIHDKGIILECNQGLSEITGYSLDELIGMDGLLLIAPETRDLVMNNILAGYEKPYEAIGLRKNGELYPIRLEARNIPYKGKTVRTVEFRDITETRQAEEALRQSEEMMRNSQSVAHISAYSTNLNVAEIQKSQWVCSPEFYKIFGIDESYPHTIEGWAALIHPDFREEVFAYHESVVKQKKSFTREYKIIRINDGAERWVHGTGELEFDKKGKPVRMHGAIQDITERKQAEEALKQSEDRFKKLSSFTFEGIIIHKDAIAIDVNQSTVEMLGFERDEIIGMNLFNLIHPDYHAIAKNNIKKQVATPYQLLVIRKNGSTFYAEIEARDISYNDEYFRVACIRDITERKKAEEALQRIEWMLSKKAAAVKNDQAPLYGDLSKLNTSRLILDAVGKDVLQDIADDFLRLLESSSAIYEKNGDYALGIFASGWCRFMDQASRELCGTDDNKKALNSGKWLCHESCWKEASLPAMESGKPVDIECQGGIHLYALPIIAGNKVIGAINFGYGDPPQDKEKLSELAEKYKVSLDDLIKRAREYPSRPPYIIEMAKERLQASANLIGEIASRKIAEKEIIKLNEELEQKIAEKTRELKERVLELERFHDATIEREFRIKELRDEIDKLKKQTR
ncbi:MAG: PAS domain S-box protein [candidate division KSB1 bacterium]|nr:PAS domain S-box protein [candidate division KSB1 bacterium]